MANKTKYVTRGECQSAMSKVAVDVDTIKRALVGNDLRGGLVKDVAGLISKVDHIIKNNQKSGEIKLRWKLAVFGAFVASVVVLIGALIK